MAKIGIRTESNIWKLYVIRTLQWFLLAMPVIVLFYQENGLTLKDIMILQAIYSIAIILFEIPSGYFADTFGRKNSIIIGSFLAFIGFGVYSLSYGFYGFLVAEIALGLGFSFISGADSALLYDTLAQTKKQNFYKQFQGRLLSYENFSEALAGIVGGFLAVISLRTPFYVEAVFLFFSAIVALSLIEPRRSTVNKDEISLQKILKVVKYALHDHKEIKWLIIYSGIISTSSLLMAWMVQPYLQHAKVPLVMFGLIWAMLNMSVGAFTLHAHRIESSWGRKRSLVSLVILTFLGYIFLSLTDSWIGIVFILIIYFVRGINNPILLDYINKPIPSEIRATILSVKAFMSRFFFSILGPVIGWISDTYSLNIALAIAGFVFLAGGMTALVYLKKYNLLR